jgi:hypothetical protein
MIMAVLYAVCILAPAAAFAVAGGDQLAHCLSDSPGITSAPHQTAATHAHADGSVHQHHATSAHVHADGSTHEHAGDHASSTAPDSGGASQGSSCCGLFSVAGIFGDPAFAFGVFSAASLSAPALQDVLSGRGPDRINRPPIG